MHAVGAHALLSASEITLGLTSRQAASVAARRDFLTDRDSFAHGANQATQALKGWPSRLCQGMRNPTLQCRQWHQTELQAAGLPLTRPE